MALRRRAPPRSKHLDRFPIPRQRRRGGFRSKDPARDDRQQVSSYTFSHADLRDIATPIDVELRGACGQKPAARPGDLVRALFGAVTR